MTLNDKKPTSEYANLESFFPLLYSPDSELTEHNNYQSKQKNKSERSGKSIKKTILIQRRSANSDILVCNSCTLTGDRWFMEKHPCRHNVNNNFAKLAKRFEV